VIDWHNLGYTMFELPDPQTPFVRKAMQLSLRKVVKVYEHTMSSLADAHLCVTGAMEGWLGENFGVHGKYLRVLYDKPPLLFCPTTVQEQHELFKRLNLEENEGISQWLSEMKQQQQSQLECNEGTLFTQSITKNGKTSSVTLRDDRPALLVSSTSWTPDEDFSILLEALDKLQILLDEAQHNNSNFQKVLVLVTGKGPQKAEYLPLLDHFNKTHVSIKIYTLWLEAVDYPKLLGCATLGISLHTSTSGLDLPMKVLDMFGCQVPVCAVGFDCLSELVKDRVNGRIFQNADELSEQLLELLDGYPINQGELQKYQTHIRGMTRWKENWEDCAQHLIVGDWDK
jgi:beta-1,4-mannosyltransferase